MLIYIAGPFRGESPWDVEENIRAAEKIGLKVAKAGAVPIIPHSMYRYFDGQLTGQFWVDATLELLKRCDGILMTRGWKRSEGSKGEYSWAIQKGLPIFHQTHYNCFEHIADYLVATGETHEES